MLLRLGDSDGKISTEIGLNAINGGNKMRKKLFVVSLLTVGVVLLCLSIIFAMIETGNKNIIGGADFPTFLFVFYREKRSLYSTLAFFGVAAIIASAVAGIAKKRR